MTPKKLLAILISLFVLATIFIWFYVSSVTAYGLPSIEILENPPQPFATQIISSDGELIDMFSAQKRLYLPYDSIPEYFKKALVAVEDRKFYKHWGVDVARVFKAAVKNLLAGGIKEGASTITMQLARNLFLTHKTTLERKVQEAYLAVKLEETFTKEEILEKYANTVCFGRGAYGLLVASKIYFDKSPKDLTLSECAFLVGILKNPEKYNGYRDYEAAIARRNLVLRLMRDQGFISESEWMDALREPINLAIKKKKNRTNLSIAPHFVEMVRQYLLKRRLKGRDLYRDGLKIYVTLNSRIQKYANEAVEEHLSKIQKVFDRNWNWRYRKDLLNKLIEESIKKRADYIAAKPKERLKIAKRARSDKKFIDSIKNAATTVQCALVALDVKTGAILAMIGASPKFMKENPYAKYSLNRAVQIRRQPGSAFKPIVYACALEKGLTPESKVSRAPFTYVDPYTGEEWSPRGSGGENIEGDSVTLYYALVHSINTVSARLITEATDPETVRMTAYRMGITTPLQAVPALALGAGGEVKPIDLISAYGSFPNKGVRTKYFGVYEVKDREENLVYKHKRTFTATDVFEPRIADMITYMLSGVINYGTGRAIRKYFENCDAAGKTGTTNDYADAWFIGYTPEIVAGVWIGFDDRRVTFTGAYGYASSAAAPLWGKFMAKIYADSTLPYKKRKFDYSSLSPADSASVENAIAKSLGKTFEAKDSVAKASPTENEKRIDN